MEETQETLLPAWIQRALMLISTLTALALYAGVLGTAIAHTITQDAPTFNANMVRAASLLSGLIGAVVTAGFASSQQPITLQTKSGPFFKALTGRRSNRLPIKLNSLSSTLGLTPRDATTQRDPLAGLTSLGLTEWIALAYFVVYFAVGVAALLVTLTRPSAHDMVSNAGWVWLGTAISSTYSYLGLNARS